jgi:hypothetical protein
MNEFIAFSIARKKACPERSEGKEQREGPSALATELVVARVALLRSPILPRTE